MKNDFSRGPESCFGGLAFFMIYSFLVGDCSRRWGWAVGDCSRCWGWAVEDCLRQRLGGWWRRTGWVIEGEGENICRRRLRQLFQKNSHTCEWELNLKHLILKSLYKYRYSRLWVSRKTGRHRKNRSNRAVQCSAKTYFFGGRWALISKPTNFRSVIEFW